MGTTRLTANNQSIRTLALVIGLLAAGAANAQATNVTEANAEKSVNCLHIKQITNTKIIDDQNIVFKVSGNKFYNNQLPHKCPGLKSANKFMYETSLSELCNVDIISVLNDFGGSLTKGASCGLGVFTPTTDPAKKPKVD